MSEIETATLEPTADCSGCDDSARIESTARDLYRTAALFVGDENEAMRLVEETVASVEMDPCADGEAAQNAATNDLVHRALTRLTLLRPSEMHPSTGGDLGGCVDTDDLSAAGISRQQLDLLLGGSHGASMRQWLEGLGPVERSVFVLRAVLGRSGADSASALAQATGEAWTESHIGGAYRSALCSLASSLVHSTAR